MEAQAVVQRMQLLGFNAVRLPFTFAELMKDPPRNYSSHCQRPTPAQVQHLSQLTLRHVCGSSSPCSTLAVQGLVTGCRLALAGSSDVVRLVMPHRGVGCVALQLCQGCSCVGKLEG